MEGRCVGENRGEAWWPNLCLTLTSVRSRDALQQQNSTEVNDDGEGESSRNPVDHGTVEQVRAQKQRNSCTKRKKARGSLKNLVSFVKTYQLNRHTLTSVNQDGYPQQSVDHVEYSSPMCVCTQKYVTVMWQHAHLQVMLQVLTRFLL